MTDTTVLDTPGVNGVELLADERLAELVERALRAERRVLALKRLARPEQMTDAAVREMDRRHSAIHAGHGEKRQAYERIVERLQLLVAEAARR